MKVKESTTIRNYEVPYFNDELFVALPGTEMEDLISKIEEYTHSYGYHFKLQKGGRKAIEETIKEHYACYLYLGNHGRDLHLLALNDPKLCSVHTLYHELVHFQHQIFKLKGVEDEEMAATFIESWGYKLSKDLNIEMSGINPA